MKTTLEFRPVIAALLIAWLLGFPVYATCGGGGGGGLGGIATGGTAEAVYFVPWAFVAELPPEPLGDLTVYWFPTGPDNAQSSPMRSSRNLTNWSGQCVGVGLVPDSATLVRTKYGVSADEPMAIVVDREGEEIGRIGAEKGRLNVLQVERLVSGELSERSRSLKEQLKEAKQLEKAGDADGAADLYGRIATEGCLFPGLAKKAGKALEKMGRPVPDMASAWEMARADLRPSTTKKIVALMEEGLRAERAEELEVAQRSYERAHALDPNDPVVLRFLGELHRHHTGNWQEAQRIFREVLARPADRLSRAVALHGLGKMTIHGGAMEEGLALFHESLEAYPLALTYRNLAVYWNTEKDHKKAWGFVEKALELDPEDPFNQIFAATYFVELGRQEEALAVAEQHVDVLAASYNLAAIHAQLGNRAETFELLKRHFYVYEQYEAVRAKEMKEARDDIVFVRYHQDPEFVALTSLADSPEHRYTVSGGQ